MPKIMIILGSVREAGIGQAIGGWVRDAVAEDGRFDVDYADLREIALPLMDEPNHPRLRQYTKPHTIEWSRRVDEADAFILAFPEYNHSYSAPIKNALDYLSGEWDRKPVSFVNWGGNSGGTRAQAALIPAVTALGMVMTHGLIEINLPNQQIDDGRFAPNGQQSAVLRLILDEMGTLDSALSPTRTA